MPGFFSKSARPKRPGGYFRWLTQQPDSILPNIGSIVALATTHDWGPINTVTPCLSFADFQQKFGPTTTTEAYTAVKGCFKGEGVAGRGGAGAVLVYRMGTGSAAVATLTLQNTAGTPAGAIRLDSVYKGSYGNKISIVTQDNALDNTKDDLIVYVDGVPVETFTFLQTDIADLAAQINGTGAYVGSLNVSEWVDATMLVTGTALAAHASPVSLASGNDGSVVTGTEISASQSALETQRFSVWATSTDLSASGGAPLASTKTWAVAANLAGKRFMAVVGSGLSDTVSLAITRSGTLANENFINLGGFTVVDDELGTLASYQLAPRIAGILAQRGETASITFARLAGVTAGTLPTESDILRAFDGGVVVLSQDSDADAPIRIEKGLTTYTSTADKNKPYLIYRNPKFVRTMHGIELELTDWAAANGIGTLPVNDATRAFVVGHAREVLAAREAINVIQTGFTVGVDGDPPPSDDDEFVALKYGIAFGRSVEQIFNSVYVS